MRSSAVDLPTEYCVLTRSKYSFDCFSMPVLDTILIGRHNKQKWRTTAKDLTIVHKAMDMLDLESLAMHGFNELSAGQHQRVALARGLVQETPVLILDEPTANLDVKHQVYVAEMLRDLATRSGITVIMISHDLQAALRYATHVLHVGNRVFFGTKANYLASEAAGSFWKGGGQP